MQSKVITNLKKLRISIPMIESKKKSRKKAFLRERHYLEELKLNSRKTKN